jgi:hypothetical protein
MSCEFIEPLDEKPEIKRKTYGEKNKGEKIIKEFMEVGCQYARIRFDKVKDEYESTTSLAREIDRTVSKMNLSNQIDVYSDKGNKVVYLERK